MPGAFQHRLGNETRGVDVACVAVKGHAVLPLEHWCSMDLNDLRIFERVGALLSFSAAGRALGVPKSGVSRSVARLATTRQTLSTQKLEQLDRDYKERSVLVSELIKLGKALGSLTGQKIAGPAARVTRQMSPEGKAAIRAETSGPVIPLNVTFQVKFSVFKSR